MVASQEYTKSKSLHLPHELYRLIIEGVHEKSDLYTLLFVSRNVRDEAERVLYRILVVNDPYYRRRIQLLHHLVNSNHVAILVRSLQIDSLPYPANCSKSIINLYWSTVHQALRAVKSLKELTILDCLFFSSPLICLLTGCTFRLRSLAVHIIDPSNQRALEAQTELEELELSSARGAQFSRQSFPRLSFLSAITFREATFPNARHTVTHLELKSGIIIHPGCLPFYMIKSLHVHRHTSTWRPLSMCPTPFPSLRYLKYTFFVVCSFDDEVDGILGQGTTLSQLEKLYFIWMRAVEPSALDFSKLFSHLRNLQTVAVQMPRNGAEEYCAEWVRDVPQYKFVPPYPEGWKDRSWADA